MSPELALVEKQEKGTESVRDIKNGLEANYTSAQIDKGGALSLRPDIKTMMECRNQDDGMVSQELQMVVKAGGEFFSVVDVFVADSDKGHKSTTMLTRRVEGDRAEIVGFIEPGDKPLIVGRTDDNVHKSNLSRKHFAIGRNAEDGHIDIMDLNSSNGTEVFVSLDEKDGKSDSGNPAEDSSLWSVKSSKLKSAVLNAA